MSGLSGHGTVGRDNRRVFKCLGSLNHPETVMRSGKDKGGEQGISHEAEKTELEEKEGPSLYWLECPASHSQRCGSISSGILLASFPSTHRDFILYSIFLSLSIILQFDNNRSLMEYTQ